MQQIFKTRYLENIGEFMKLILVRILVPMCLIMSAGTSIANNSTDYFLQNDRMPLEEATPEGLSNYYQEYVEWLLEQGYSPASIIISSVGRGMTLADAVYLMSRVQPESAKDYFNTAESLLPNLPGWVCSNSNSLGHRYDKPLDRPQLTSGSTLEEVADLYFEENERFIKVPDWQNGVGHASARVDELIKFKQIEIDRVSSDDDHPVDSWWFLEQFDIPSNVVVVGLYPDDKRLVIDARLDELEALKQQGTASLPVMFMYNDVKHIPMSDVERVPDESYGGSTMKGGEHDDYVDLDDGEISASEVINRFEADEQMVPPTREWRRGDHHLMVRTEELLELFTVPEKDEIDPKIWQQSVARLNQMPVEPIHISLFRDAKGERWLDDSSVVAVAKEQDRDRVPVVFFYHGMDRQPCGMPSACISDIRAAAIAGSNCPECIGRPPKPPTNVPPVIVPPGDGPISPN